MSEPSSQVEVIQSVEELLRRYADGERYFVDIDLPDGANLGGVTLSGTHFHGGFLVTADFRNANLQEVRFECNVKCANFEGADLTGASFEGAPVESTQFRGAILTGTQFKGAFYMGFELTEEDIPDPNF